MKPFKRNYTVSPPYTISLHRRMDECSRGGSKTKTEETGKGELAKKVSKRTSSQMMDGGGSTNTMRKPHDRMNIEELGKMNKPRKVKDAWVAKADLILP